MTEATDKDAFERVLEKCMRRFAHAVAETSSEFVVHTSQTAREQFRNAVGHLLSLNVEVSRLEAYVKAVGATIRGDVPVDLIEFVRAELSAEMEAIIQMR
jgi:hypothetical protein